MNYSFLEPIQIGNMKVRNRIMYLAMAKNLSDKDGFVTDKQIEYYANMARGGVGLIVTGAGIIDNEWPSTMIGQPGFYDDKFIPGLTRLIDAVHKHGSKVFCQLWHPGQVDYSWEIEEVPKTVNELTLEEMEIIKQKYVKGASVAKCAGADGIEIQICHNYLMAQFLSPHFNKRTDNYGGSLKNRLRYPIEVITAIKEKFGKDFLMSVKVNGSDFLEDGINPEMAAEAGIYLEKAGADMLVMSGGGEESLVYGMSGDGDYEEGWKVPFAELVKTKVSIPVAATGSIRHPEYMDSIITDGKCDLIGLGRALLAEPHLVNKVMNGQEKQIRYCMSCMHCFDETAPGHSGCTVNPFALRSEEKPELIKNGDGRTVVCVGAGPANIEAAMVLAERGFKPVIFEKESQLGGMMQLAKQPLGKHKMEWLLEFYRNEIERLGIDIRYNTPATEESITALNPYAIIFATGSTPLLPPIPGIKGSNVYEVRDILANKDSFKVSGKRIIVAGAGATGLETARTMHEWGNEVTIVEMMPRPQYGDPGATYDKLLTISKVFGTGVIPMYSHKLLSIGETDIEVEDTSNGKKIKLPADMIIMSLGVRPDHALYDIMKETHPNVFNIGDSQKIGQIIDAIHAGNTLGYQLGA
ncbi:MAG: NAD(P)/FAD-dependent oxidoreductase [Eubacteriales bacterium]|nr:NAD(P)/FAD-dependent oxidoreductase [Eubacteriales bacterium]